MLMVACVLIGAKPWSSYVNKYRTGFCKPGISLRLLRFDSFGSVVFLYRSVGTLLASVGHYIFCLQFCVPVLFASRVHFDY